MAQSKVWRKVQLPVGYLPDCGSPRARTILSGMLNQSFKLFAAEVILAAASLAAGCTRVQTAAPPSLPEVTAAPAVARDVTEWD